MSSDPTVTKSNYLVADAIAAALQRHGVELTFGQSLPSAVQLANTDIGIRQIGYRTENAGACMADGYARISGKVGVVTAQNGPAATLLVPGLAEAYKASIPLIALVQDVNRPTVDRNAFQELDHFDLFSACAKWVRRISDADRVDDYIDMAFTVAASGRMGPAVLLLPADLLNEPAAASDRSAMLGRYPLDRMVADPSAIAAAADLIANADNPLVVAGGGVHLSSGHDVLSKLQEVACLPVATTVMGKGVVDEHHSLSLGTIGYIMGERSATRHQRPLVNAADVILLIGSRTNQNGTDSWTLFPPGATIIHLDVDSAEVGRNYEAVRLVGDARLTLEALLAALETRDLTKRRSQRNKLEAEIASGRQKHEAEAADVVASDRSPIRPERIMSEIQSVLTPETIVVADASYSSVWIVNYLRALRAGMRFITPRGLAGLGWGFPMALGAKLAAPESPVLCVAGDGGFGHCWQELETARRMGVNVVVTVLNNGVLGYQKDAEDAKFGRHTDACAFHPVDHARIAEACGCRGVRIENPADYGAALREALGADRTTLIDVVTDPDAYPPVTAFDGLRDR
jgi:acetolactate synthase-1/2/3 large subunit